MATTKQWKSLRPSPAMAVAVLALVVATSGGTAVAASLVVTSSQIKDGTILSQDIHDGTIQSRDVKDNNLTGADVKTGSLTSADVKDNSLTSTDVKDDSLTGTDVKNDSLTGTDVKNDSLTGSDVKESSLGTVPNAAKLGGLAANQIVRASSVTSTTVTDNFAAPTFTTLVTRTVTAPTKGILLVWGSITGSRDIDGPATADLAARATVDGAAATATGGLFLEWQGSTEGVLNVNGAIPVAAGTHTVALQAQSQLGQEYLTSKSITTLFVPFGDSGVQGSTTTPAPAVVLPRGATSNTR